MAGGKGPSIKEELRVSKTTRPSGRGARHGRCSGVRRVRGFRERQEAHQGAEGKGPGRAPEAGQEEPGRRQAASFLRRAALVNFKLPVTIRLRNPCTTENGQNPQPTVGGNPVGVALSTELPDAGHGAQPAHDPDGERQPRSVARYAFGRDWRRAGSGCRVPGHLRRWRAGQRQPQDPPGQQDADDLVGAAALEQGHHRPGDALRRELRQVASLVPAALCAALAAARRLRRARLDQQGCGDWTRRRGWRSGLRYGDLRGARSARRPAYKALFYDVPANLGLRHGRRSPGLHRCTPLAARRTACSCRSFAGVDNPDEHPGWWRDRATTTGSVRTRTRSRPARLRRAPALRRRAPRRTATRVTPCSAPTLCPWASPRAACRST